MRTFRVASIIVPALLAISAATAAAQTDPSKAMQYKLEPASAFETGCFNMCACPIITHPLKGTFTLEHTGFDPLFDYYNVSNVRWVVTDATTYFTITGSGTYKIGGEFALQHQLTLDLSLDGDPPLRFDSGLVVTGGSSFPNIVIDIRRHAGAACIDTVIHVDATDPVTTAVEQSGASRAPTVVMAPNPFGIETELRLTLPRAGAVEAVIFDVRGRAVRHLKSGWLPAGVHVLHWDGLRDQGSACAAGVYFATTRVGETRLTSRIVKVN
jgi:hypothetical protein